MLVSKVSYGILSSWESLIVQTEFTKCVKQLASEISLPSKPSNGLAIWPNSHTRRLATLR